MKSKKSLILIAFLFVFFANFFSVSDVKAKNAIYKWKLATLAPDGVGWAIHIKELFHPAIDTATNNAVQFTWYWGGIMGNDEDYIAKMRIGQLQGMGFSGTGFVMACPEGAVLELPFLFQSYEELDYVKENMRDDFDAVCKKNGFKFLFWVDQDFDQVYSVKSEMRTPKDFAKSRFLTWYGPIEEEVLKKIGVSPIPVNVPDVSSSIRSGICDAFIAPSVWTVGSQLYSTMKYVNPIKIRYSPAGAIVTQTAWNTLTPEVKKQIEGLKWVEAEFNNRLRASNKKCLNTMIKYGMKEVKMTDEEITVFKKLCMPLWYELADKEYPKALLNKIIMNLAEFRAKNN